jgi:hypothetical protein
MFCPNEKNEKTNTGIFQKIKYTAQMVIIKPISFVSQLILFSSWKYTLVIFDSRVRTRYIEVNNAKANDIIFLSIRMSFVFFTNSLTELKPNIVLMANKM